MIRKSSRPSEDDQGRENRGTPRKYGVGAVGAAPGQVAAQQNKEDGHASKKPTSTSSFPAADETHVEQRQANVGRDQPERHQPVCQPGNRGRAQPHTSIQVRDPQAPEQDRKEDRQRCRAIKVVGYDSPQRIAAAASHPGRNRSTARHVAASASGTNAHAEDMRAFAVPHQHAQPLQDKETGIVSHLVQKQKRRREERGCGRSQPGEPS